MSSMQEYRVQFRMSVDGLTPEVLEAWVEGTLEALTQDEAVGMADAGAALVTGDVDFDLHVQADDVVAAGHVAYAALARATSAGVSAAAGGPATMPGVEHAEVDRVLLTA